MHIKDILSPGDVITDLRFGDKTELLRDLATRMASSQQLDITEVCAAVLNREELGSTGVGDGVALPHARIRDLGRPVGLLARLKKSIDFAAIDGKPVDLVFLLLLPGAPDGEQLNALASVARKLRKPDVLTGLRRARDRTAVYEAMVAD